MKRRNYIGTFTSCRTTIFSSPFAELGKTEGSKTNKNNNFEGFFKTNAVLIGGGLDGFVATIALLRNSKTVILTEETDWIGGQLTQQGVPPNEYPWIETTGSTQT